MPNTGAILLPRASEVRLSTPRGASAVRNLVNLLDKELALRPVSWTLSVVGIVLSPTVGLLLFHELKSALSVLLVINNPSCRRLLSTACLRCVAQRLSATRRCLFSCSSCITVLMALHEPPVMAPRGSPASLHASPCFRRPRADPYVLFFHTLSPRAARGRLDAHQPLFPTWSALLL